MMRSEPIIIRDKKSVDYHADFRICLFRSENRLPAVYTRHADPSQVFGTDSASSSIKGKGRAIPNSNGDLDDEESGPILPGVVSKWGELPRVKKSKNQKKKEKEATAGKNWFDLPRRPAASLSNEEKRELQAMRLTNVMDPKKFMRGETKRDNKKLPEFFQVRSFFFFAINTHLSRTLTTSLTCYRPAI
jgi:hypothetical protein